MGNQCMQDNKSYSSVSNNYSQFQGIQFLSVIDDPNEEKNLKQIKVPPSIHIGKRVNIKPKLFKTVQKTRERQLTKKPLIRHSEIGIKLPIYYLNKYRVYYDGQWNNGLPSGEGQIYFGDGSYYQGPMLNGQMTGQDGIYIYSDGSFKRGSMKNGSMQGDGVYVSQNLKNKYEGQWNNDKPHGKGIQNYLDGGVYEGEFLQGKKNDQNGTYKWPNGKVYTGQFRNGFMEGHGKIFMANGQGQYIGQFSRNLMVGHGIVKTETGVYTGPFQNGQMHGKGIFKWNDNKYYEGQFFKGQLHGEGIMNFPNGQKIQGIWHHGENLSIKNFTRGSNQKNI